MVEQLSGTIPTRNPAVRWRQEGDKVLLERSMALNEMGAFIWTQCDGQHTFEQVVAEICRHYEVESEDAVRQDVRDFLLDLYANNLILIR